MKKNNKNFEYIKQVKERILELEGDKMKANKNLEKIMISETIKDNKKVLLFLESLVSHIH